MNASEEVVTPKDSSVPVHKSAHYHFKTPRGIVLGNERGIEKSLVRYGNIKFALKSLIHVMGMHARVQKKREERHATERRQGEISGLMNVHNRGPVFWRPSGAVCLGPGPGWYIKDQAGLQNCEEMSCHGGLATTKQLFQTHSHILGLMHYSTRRLWVIVRRNAQLLEGRDIVIAAN